MQSSDKEQSIRQAYAAFNRRDIDGVLRLMRPDVRWPRAFKGGFVSGAGNVREYWTEQWSEIDPHVEPVGFEERADGTVAVTVHQVVKDLQGGLMAEGDVEHVYRFEDGLIAEMSIGAE